MLEACADGHFSISPNCQGDKKIERIKRVSESSVGEGHGAGRSSTSGHPTRSQGSCFTCKIHFLPAILLML
jgi:hypothetical protein